MSIQEIHCPAQADKCLIGLFSGNKQIRKHGGKKTFKAFPGCGHDFFNTRIAKLVFDLGRGRRLSREKQRAHKSSPRGFCSRRFG